MKNKQRVHNLLEAKVLIKEAFSRGNEDKFENTEWFTHDGEFICKSSIYFTDFRLHLADGSDLVVEVDI